MSELKNSKKLLNLLGSLVFLFLCSCHTEGTSVPQSPEKALSTHGKTIYATVCIACHNADPHKAGAIGPEIFGSSKELIEARVLNASYPPGYKPKRETKTMAAFPQFKGDIDALYAYLNSSD